MAFQFQLPNVEVREVWQSNLAEEIELIQRCSSEFRFASIDTEFPGTVDVPKHGLSPAQHYVSMKQNVDALNMIQLGLTLSDSSGNLPRFGSDAQAQHVWQFNFRDLDSEKGIHWQAFAWIFRNSGLGLGPAWITFHGLYDSGFLIKILTRKPLPDDLSEFMKLMRRYFGMHVYDLKPIVARVLGLHGGLETVAENLGLDRAEARKSCRAGSRSLLKMQAFFRLVMNNFTTSYLLQQFNYMLYGLTCT